MAFAIGCGDDSNGGDSNDNGGSSAEPASLEELEEGLVDSICDRAFDCCSEQEREELAETDDGDLFESEESCQENAAESAGLSFDPLEESVDEGRADFDEQAAGECLEWAEEQDCSAGVRWEYVETGSACEDVFSGNLEDGDDCYAFEECDEDTSCVGLDTVGGDPGTCRPYGDDQGDPCHDETSCADGLYCEIDEEGENTCRELPEVGESCEDGYCEEGAFCDGSDGEPTCEEQLADGEECESYEECQSYNCADLDSGGTGTCEPPEDEGEQMCTGEE
ncbi:MAG: hypothetical protein ACOCV2_11515 [Persicimonas sp.]